MRLLTFEQNGRAALGVARGDRVIDVAALDSDFPRDWADVLAGEGVARLRDLCEDVPESKTLARDSLRLLPPIPQPPKILCVGLNYRHHAEETGVTVPAHPIIFARFPSSMVGDGQALVRPKVSEKYDYEGEMVAVIGRPGKHIPAERALDHVAGYSIFNEGSVRDFQKRGRQWTLGKNFDASAGFGPEIVTADELPAGGSGLRITTRLNGEVVQDSRTDDLIFDVPALIAAISEVMRLDPGTLIVTGTPSGVGFVRTPPLYMTPGDSVSVSIEKIGALTNPVVAEEDLPG